MTVSLSIGFRIRNISEKKGTENQNTGAIYEIIRKNMIEPERPQMTIWRMLFAFWIKKASDTLRLCNTYSLSTVKIVIGTRRTVSLYVISQSSYIYYYCGMSVLFLVESSHAACYQASCHKYFHLAFVIVVLGTKILH
jgi:hypothetical protein